MPQRYNRPMHILDAILPIFVIISIGYLSVRTNWLPAAALHGIGRLIMNVGFPILIFKSVADFNFERLFAPWFIASFAIGGLVTLALSYVFFRKIFANDVSDSGLKALGSAHPNSINIGYPLVLLLFGEDIAATLSLVLVVETLLILPLGLVLIDVGRVQDTGQGFTRTLMAVALRQTRNPLFIALMLGLVVALTGLQLPHAIDTALGLVAKASPPIALIYVGGLLVGTSLIGSMRSILAVSGFKLLLQPLLVAAVVMLAPDFDPVLQTVVILFAASPMATLFTVVGAQSERGELAASIFLAATVSWFVTITVILWLLGV